MWLQEMFPLLLEQLVHLLMQVHPTVDSGGKHPEGWGGRERDIVRGTGDSSCCTGLVTLVCDPSLPVRKSRYYQGLQKKIVHKEVLGPLDRGLG